MTFNLTLENIFQRAIDIYLSIIDNRVIAGNILLELGLGLLLSCLILIVVRKMYIITRNKNECNKMGQNKSGNWIDYSEMMKGMVGKNESCEKAKNIEVSKNHNHNQNKILIMRKLLNIERNRIEKRDVSELVEIKNKKLVIFELNYPDAKTVALVGEFNGWCAKPNGNGKYWPFIKEEDGIWRTLYYLPAGFHEYKFVINGEQYVLDPSNDKTINDGNGGFNSVKRV